MSERKRTLIIRALWVLAAVWFIVLMRLTVFRRGCFTHGLFTGTIRLEAFAYYAKLLRTGKLGYFCYLFFGNIVWFAPAGFVVRMRRGRLLHALIAGFALSLFVEVMQFVLGSGDTELDDLILNTLGALIGYAFGCLCLKRLVPREA
ncbi:MAG: VanZ family protein [Clostridia bacterium]|nr:VanZ family protein [Clostridia bacterium]